MPTRRFKPSSTGYASHVRSSTIRKSLHRRERMNVTAHPPLCTGVSAALRLSRRHRTNKGFAAAISARDGLTAALHTPHWARENLEAACFLLLYHQDDFVRGD